MRIENEIESTSKWRKRETERDRQRACVQRKLEPHVHLCKVGSLWATQPRSNSRPCSSKGGQPLCPFSSRRFYLFSIIARSPHRPPLRRTQGKGKWQWEEGFEEERKEAIGAGCDLRTADSDDGLRIFSHQHRNGMSLRFCVVVPLESRGFHAFRDYRAICV